MNAEQLDLARRLAAHPRFEWRRGTQPVYDPAPFVWSIPRVEEDGWNPQHCDDIARPDGWPDAKREAWPDLTDDATGGVLLGMLVQVCGDGVGWFIKRTGTYTVTHGVEKTSKPGLMRTKKATGTTLAEACARALLAEWTTASTPENPRE